MILYLLFPLLRKGYSDKQEGNLLAQGYVLYLTHYQMLIVQVDKVILTFLYQKRLNLLIIS